MCRNVRSEQIEDISVWYLTNEAQLIIDFPDQNRLFREISNKISITKIQVFA